MKRLLHPIRAIREPFGTAGLIVACLALVLALGGAAVAASGGLSGKQKKEVEKIAKKFAGKPGASGATGPAGKEGAAGKDGTNGTPGTNGTNGGNGHSVVVVNEEPENCPNEEGVTYEVEGSGNPNEICNGEPGAIHAGAILPSGTSETGSWIATSNTSENVGPVSTAISFPIPLANPLSGNHVHYLVGEATSGHGELTSGSKTVEKVETESGKFQAGQEIRGEGIPAGTLIASVDTEAETLTLTASATETGTKSLNSNVPAADAAACPGTVADPKADEGNLCVYVAEQSNLGPEVQAPFHPINPPTSGLAQIVAGAGTSGALLTLAANAQVPRKAYGTWAVTAS